MYLGVDVGGTKTLIAALNDDGVIRETRKFPTPKNYHNFVLEVRHALVHLEHHDFKAAGVGIPVTEFDREHDRAKAFGNLPWRNVDVGADIERASHCPTVVENDAKLGALSEAMLLKDSFKRVLYITVSTGIGVGFVVDGTIDTNVSDGGGRTMLLEHRGKLMPWEEIASGHAIVERYGKPAHDITDDATWQTIARELARGIIELIAIMQPEVIVFGGSVGVYFDRYADFLRAELKKVETPFMQNPVLREAQRPEEAVIFGCYDLAKAIYGRSR